MHLELIQDPESSREVTDALDASDEFALDLEAAGFHRYSDSICLVQVSTRNRTWLLDPLAFDVRPVLRDAVEDPRVRTVMHGADFDLRLLDRDLDLTLKGLFDTQVGAALLGEPAIGLSSLLEKHLGVRLSKKHQKADWARRPLTEEQRTYAAADTRHLLELADILEDALRERGRLSWALSESREMEGIRWEETSGEDPVTGVKGADELGSRELERLREALEWRDEIARDEDRAPFRIAADRALLEVAVTRPRSPDDLGRISNMSRRVRRQRGRELLRRLDLADERPEDELRPHPPIERGEGRPAPEVEDRTRRLRSVRNEIAAELGIDRGTLLPNSTLQEIARAVPESVDALENVAGVKEWQVEATGEELISVLLKERA